MQPFVLSQVIDHQVNELAGGCVGVSEEGIGRHSLSEDFYERSPTGTGLAE